MSKRFRTGEASVKDKRVQQDHPFRHSEKYAANTRCPECGLLYEDGVWKKNHSGSKTAQDSKICPACIAARGGIVGGVVQLGGTFVALHRQDLLNRIHNVESQTSEERPLERILSIKEFKDEIIVSATSEHLAARIGKAIHRDFGGTLDLKYAPEEKFATARWHREA